MTSITPESVNRFLDILDRVTLTAGVPPPPTLEASKPEIVADTEDERQAGANGLTAKYKAVDEIWDTAAYKYIIVDSSESISEEKELIDCAFIVRRRFDKSNTVYKYFVDIRSEGLRDILREILKEVKGVSLREDKPTVSPKLLFHYLAQFEKDLALRKSSACPGPAEPDNALCHTRQLEVLVEFLKEHFASTIESRQALLKHGEIRFDLLWTLFPPNTFVYTESYEFNLPRCLKVNWSEEENVRGGRVFMLDCCYFGNDGESLGDASISLVIEEFRGEEEIRSLGIFPLIYHEKAEEVRNNLIQMGRTFMSLRGKHHREYKGFAFARKNGKVNMVYMKGRVMIDADSFKRRCPNYETPKIKADSFGIYPVVDTTSVKESNHITKRIMPDEVKEENLLTCSPTVFGFSFRSKEWAEFAVTSLQEIRWDTNPFQSLVLPKRRKEIIQALIESHMSERADQSFDDIVKGKGQGLIFLFHGAPGVGKTLTAEGVSDFLRRPLYIVSAGDLSTRSDRLEAELSQIFDLADHWNAILLLDEADVFLQKRDLQSLERNGMVSVFLRLLEYLQGILILTTNRVETFDTAVQSRINLPLKFNDLDELARKSIWETFLKKSCKVSGGRDVTNVISPDQLNGLARKELNGREIKNTVHTAHSLAINKNVSLSYKHLELALSVTEDFKHDLADLGQAATIYA
ncbi:MAG: hypothetical protein M1813_001787 [Trichoglossum hirsutum]|nr:MAG: hypothetical protein M1813_001787 [Trichoglossum hirsutum]